MIGSFQLNSWTFWGTCYIQPTVPPKQPSQHIRPPFTDCLSLSFMPCSMYLGCIIPSNPQNSLGLDAIRAACLQRGGLRPEGIGQLFLPASLSKNTGQPAIPNHVFWHSCPCSHLCLRLWKSWFFLPPLPHFPSPCHPHLPTLLSFTSVHLLLTPPDHLEYLMSSSSGLTWKLVWKTNFSFLLLI